MLRFGGSVGVPCGKRNFATEKAGAASARGREDDDALERQHRQQLRIGGSSRITAGRFAISLTGVGRRLVLPLRHRFKIDSREKKWDLRLIVGQMDKQHAVDELACDLRQVDFFGQFDRALKAVV